MFPLLMKPHKELLTMRFLRLKEVMHITALSRSTIYLKMNKDEFPKSLSLGDRAVAWRSDDIDEWVEQIIISSQASKG